MAKGARGHCGLCGSPLAPNGRGLHAPENPQQPPVGAQDRDPDRGWSVDELREALHRGDLDHPAVQAAGYGVPGHGFPQVPPSSKGSSSQPSSDQRAGIYAESDDDSDSVDSEQLAALQNLGTDGDHDDDSEIDSDDWKELFGIDLPEGHALGPPSSTAKPPPSSEASSESSSKASSSDPGAVGKTAAGIPPRARGGKKKGKGSFGTKLQGWAAGQLGRRR
jgi:hypothetical protein